MGHIGWSLKHMKLELGHYRLIRDQRGPEGVGELTTISPGAGMVQMGPEWVRLGGV